MKKLYKNEENWNDLEKQTSYASYSTLINRFCDDLLLCNNIVDIDFEIYDNIIIGELNEETDIYQYFLTDLNDYDIEKLQELTQNNNDIIIAYSNVLDLYVLMVDHFGTPWDYVPTNVKLTDDINEI